MLFAVDYNDNRVHIDQIHSNQTYYCPYCGVPLTVRKGEIRKHHFAHTQQHRCTDTWAINEHDGGYDTSSWHNEWQSCFPKENQEIKLTLGEIKHRADVLIDRTVIEFQHSIMSEASFDDRNNFYANLGYKVVWLFDMSDLYAKGQMEIEECANELKIFWKNPKKAFNCYDIQNGCIDLFFQIGKEEKCIIRVKDVSENGFEEFIVSSYMSKDEFLSYVGMKDGICLPPYREDVAQDREYQTFKDKYNIQLNKQQERAVQAIEGAILLLAVPGSGKTTVLVDRLGYMVLQKNIKPENILAITFGDNAAKEMRERFSKKFGYEIGAKIEFRTINSLSNSIYVRHCKEIGREKRKLIEGYEHRKLLWEVFYTISNHFANENDIQEMIGVFSRIKNMMLTEEEVRYNENLKHFEKHYEEYERIKNERCLMDYDDQMVFALEILMQNTEMLNAYRSQYKYICVDEAQDTSKIQHAIIHKIADGNNIFMVGDEDQSIYGFRGAYPKALLNFKYDYQNPYILRMEHNYRSTPQIVEKAQAFISKNKGRYEKNMSAEKSAGEEVQIEEVATREEQYNRLIEIAESTEKEIAFLYRDNESAVVCVDAFLRDRIPFSLKAPKVDFFNVHIVKDIMAYLSLAVNKHDHKSLRQINGKGILSLPKTQLDFAVKWVKEQKLYVEKAVAYQEGYLDSENQIKAKEFLAMLKQMPSMTPAKAINCILESGYLFYLEEHHYSTSKLEIIKMLAKKEESIGSFLKRMDKLKEVMKKDVEREFGNKVVLSTIHSSKGQEYDSVYMVDVYDGRFPASRSNPLSSSKDNDNGEQEERRLFYVGITRAKNTLKFFSIKDKPSSYIEELFPEIVEKRVEEDIERKIRETEERNTQKSKDRAQEVNNIYENVEANRKIRIVEERQASKSKRQTVRQKCYEEVKDMFADQETPIYDSQNNRWVKCETCGEINTTDFFAFYGGKNGALGVCNSCNKKKK